MLSEASPKPGSRRRVGRTGADTQIQRPLKEDERNPMNLTTAVGNKRFGKGDRW